MNVRNNIEKRIEEERLKIATWREQAERAEAFMQGLQEALKLIPREARQKKPRRASKRKGMFRSGSDTEKVYQLLRQAAKPMHVGDILVGIGKQNTHANRMSLASTLSRYVRNNKVFTRPIPNSFALKENTSAQTTEKTAEILPLPKEFGAEDVKQSKQQDDIPF